MREDKPKKQLSHKEYRKDLAVLRIRLLVTQTALLKKRLAYTRKKKRLASPSLFWIAKRGKEGNQARRIVCPASCAMWPLRTRYNFKVEVVPLLWPKRPQAKPAADSTGKPSGSPAQAVRCAGHRLPLPPFPLTQRCPPARAHPFSGNTASDGGEASFPVYQKEKAMDKPHIAQECPKAIEKSSRLRYRFTP